MSMIPIASYTVTASGGDATISFSNIPSTFTHLQMRIFARGTSAATSTEIYTTFNSDTGNNYFQYHQIFGNGASATSNAGSTSTSMIWMTTGSASLSANIFTSGIFDILDYANTNKNKTVRSIQGYDANGSGAVHFRSNLWMSTSAISSIQMTLSNFAQNSRIDLYGITNSPATGA